MQEGCCWAWQCRGRAGFSWVQAGVLLVRVWPAPLPGLTCLWLVSCRESDQQGDWKNESGRSERQRQLLLLLDLCAEAAAFL